MCTISTKLVTFNWKIQRCQCMKLPSTAVAIGGDSVLNLLLNSIILKCYSLKSIVFRNTPNPPRLDSLCRLTFRSFISINESLINWSLVRGGACDFGIQRKPNEPSAACSALLRGRWGLSTNHSATYRFTNQSEGFAQKSRFHAILDTNHDANSIRKIRSSTEVTLQFTLYVVQNQQA